MRILQCHIENFGKWSDKTFDFSEGCNIFCEENGWGKSTLAVFLRVMFFGFENERKRDEFENERKKYHPWQGGVYGGQMTFEIDGTEYLLVRTFGKKEKDDIFDLRYVKTNLKADDFSTNLGEEIFHIDSISFMKSVFISQSDCETKMTDGMNAKIGNLESQKGDLGNYEIANENLANVLNKMSPTRKTGSLYKLVEEIGALQMRIRQGSFVEQSIEKLAVSREEEKERLKQLELDKRKCLEKQREINEQREMLGKLKEYEGYCENYQNRKLRYQCERSYFPTSLPKKDDLDGYLQRSSRLLEEKRSSEIYHLTEAEESLMQRLENENVGKESEHVRSGFDDRQNLGEKRARGVERNVRSRTVQMGFALGLLMIVVGIAGYLAKMEISLVAAFAGVAVCMCAIFFNLRASSNMKAIANENAEIKKMELQRYHELKEKACLYENACQKYMSLQTQLESCLRELGFEPAEDLQGQLQDMKTHFMNCKNAFEEYKRAKEKKESFESAEDIEQILRWKNLNLSISAMSSDHLHQILDEIDSCKTEISKMDSRLEQLMGEKDEIAECKIELEHQQELYEKDKAKYEYLKKVQIYLQKAKESFSAKYAGPIKIGFDKYYELLTGDLPSEYRIDVNSNLTAEVYGMQRDNRLLSNGYRDLTGLCMRMAFVDAMYPNQKPFLILDDPFVNLDERKTEKGLRLLEQIGKEYQILYFTCHKSRV